MSRSQILAQRETTFRIKLNIKNPFYIVFGIWLNINKPGIGAIGRGGFITPPIGPPNGIGGMLGGIPGIPPPMGAPPIGAPENMGGMGPEEGGIIDIGGGCWLKKPPGPIFPCMLFCILPGGPPG